MPVRAVCPECGATTSFDDSAPAASFVCHQCGGTVAVPAAKAGPPPLPRPGPPPLPVPAAAPAAAAGFEVLDEDGDSAVAVADRPKPSRPAARPPFDDDEYEILRDVGDEPEPDEEPDKPDEADEDEDGSAGVPRIKAFVGNFEPGTRPLPRRKGQSARSKSPLLVIGGVFAALLLLGGGAVAAYMLWPDKSDDKPVAINDDAGPADPEQPAATTSIPLPGKVADVCVTGTGHIIVHCPAEQKLAVVHLGVNKVTQEIPDAGPGTVFAANAEELLVVTPNARTIDRYRLSNLNQKTKRSYPLPFAGTVKAMALGSRSAGPALLVMDRPADAWPVYFLDLKSEAPAKAAWGVQPLKDLPRDVRVRAAADGTAWVLTPRAPDRFPAVAVRLEGNRLGFSLPFREDPGYAVPSADGEAVYSKFGRTPLSAFPKAAPAADPEAWRVGVGASPFEMVVRPAGNRARLSVFAPGHPDPLIADLDIPRPAAPASGLTPDQTVIYHPNATTLLVVPESADRFEQVPISTAQAAVEKHPKPLTVFHTTPPRTFSPGVLYQYSAKISTNNGPLTCSTVFAPPGTRVVPETGVVVWNVPKDFQFDRAEFTLQATTAGGTIAAQTFTVFNRDAAPPKTIVPKVTPKKTPPETKPKDPEVSPKPMDPVVVAPADPIAPGAKLVNPPPARVAITPTEITNTRLDVPLGGVLRDVCVGGGGRYLIAHVPTARRLAVLDVSSGKIVKTIGLGADGVLFAAGMTKLLVVYPDEKQVLRYSLPDGKLELDAELDIRPRPVAAAMGNATAGPLVLGGPVTQNNAAKLALTFIDVETLKEVRVDKAEGDLRIGFGAAVNLRISADGRTVATWYKQLQPSGLQLVKLAGNTVTGVHKAESVGHVLPGPDGLTVFTEKGMYNLKAEHVARTDVVVPAVHGGGLLSVADAAGGAKTVTVWMGGTEPRATFTTLPGFDGKRDPFERDNPTLPLDKRLFLVPDANVLVAVPPAADRFVLVPLSPAKK